LLKKLQRVLGVFFNNETLLQHALVHSSYANENQWSKLESYERMEFLGDAILNQLVSKVLFDCGPSLDEGDLTNARTYLVRGEYLVKWADTIGLGEYIIIGRGEEVTGGRRKKAILEGSMEAIIGALFLDQGYKTTKDFVLSYIMDDVMDLIDHEIPSDPKGRLLEIIQAKGDGHPEYRITNCSGPEHEPVFSVEDLVNGQIVGTGSGKRKLDAERQAAEEALGYIRSSRINKDQSA